MPGDPGTRLSVDRWFQIWMLVLAVLTLVSFVGVANLVVNATTYTRPSYEACRDAP